MPKSATQTKITDAIIQAVSENPYAKVEEVKAVLRARGIEATDETVKHLRAEAPKEQS